jgi:histone-lysine N-methyltransferase SETD3
VTWLREGGAVFPKLTLQFYSADYRGVHASTHVFKNELILFVPKTHILTLEMAKASPIGRKMELAKLNLISPKHCFLSSLILQERRVQDSFWQPYLDILPKSFTCFPIFFTPDEKAWLTGSPFLRQIEDKIEDIKVDYDMILAIAPEFGQFSVREFSEIRVSVSSRIFGMEIDGVKTDGFVPLADMLNHKRPRQTSWSYDQAKDGFIIEANEEIDRGLEVMDSYGKKCNSRFLLNYGFIVLNNDGNEYPFNIELKPADPHYRLKKNILESYSESVFRVMATITEEVFLDVVGMLRFIELEEVHLLPQLVQECTEKGRFKVNRVLPISIKNELSVLQRLKTLAAEGLAAYPESIEEDARLLATADLTQNQRNCVLMRQGEKEILHWYLKFVDTVVPLLNMKPKDLRKFPRPAELEDYILNCVMTLVKNKD